MNDTTKTAAQIARPAPLPVIDTGEFALLLDSDRFAQIQRVAKLYSESDFVTDAFRGKVANCAIALQSAMRLRIDPVMLMQHSYLVHGKPGMEAQLVIALVNARGPFTGPLQWKAEGEGNARQWTCYATHKITGELCQRTITWAIVQAEGWDKKPGSKWLTMADQMGYYRSAAWFARLYCPEVLLGFPTTDELEDIGPQYERTVQGQAEILMPRAKAAPAAGHETVSIDPKTGEITILSEGSESAETGPPSGDIFDQATDVAKPAETAPKAPESPAPDLSKRASEAQRNMIISIAKRQGFNVAQLDEQLVERFSWGVDEMPMAMVSEVTQFVKGMKA